MRALNIHNPPSIPGIVIVAPLVLILLVGVVGCDILPFGGFKVGVEGRVTSGHDGTAISRARVFLTIGKAFNHDEDIDVSDGDGRYHVELDVDDKCLGLSSIRVEAPGGYAFHSILIGPLSAIKCKGGTQHYDVELFLQPVVKSVKPSVVQQTDTNVLVTIVGSNFDQSSVVSIAGNTWIPTFISPDGTEIRVHIDASLLQPRDGYAVFVQNDSGTSGYLNSALSVQ